MWKLNSPDTLESEKDILLAFHSSKQNKSIDLKSKDKILELYSAYDEYKGEPRKKLLGHELGEDTLNGIHKSYDLVRKNGRLAHLKNRLKLTRSKCPYCGFGEASTLDHYLPRSEYKAHSIYARNLVPCCSPCNRKKDKIAGANPDSQFLHAYFIPYFKHQFLFATVQIINKSLIVDFKIIKTIEMDEDNFRRACFQLEQLDLNNRYIPEIITFILSNKRDIERLGALGSAELKGHFIESHADSSALFGVNHWRTALWLALSQSDHFCDGGFKEVFDEILCHEFTL